MIIDVPKVSEQGSRYEGEEPPEILGLTGAKQVRVEGPVRFDLFAEKIHGELLVKGVLSVPLAFQCGRCAEFFSTKLEGLSFLHSYDISKNVETVDLTPDIREDILVELPPYPVCRPDCHGLCPQCGANLNEGPCGCRRDNTDGRWGALDRLKL